MRYITVIGVVLGLVVPTDAYTSVYTIIAPTKIERMASHGARAVDRREWLLSRIKTGGLLLLPPVATSGVRSAVAIDESMVMEEKQRMVFKQRPRAPLSVLLPATEQRMLLKEGLSLSEQLAQSSGSKDSEKDAAIQRLDGIFVNPKQEGGGTYNYYTKGLTEKKRTERDLRILEQYQQSRQRMLSGNIVRAAMNIYISNLRYGRDYSVEDAEWKSSYIRANGGLPDFRKLVQADLDLRILYMNQVQIRVDDAAAEFYAAVMDGNDADFEELRRLLRLANDSMEAWFQLIEVADVADAANAVERGVTIKLSDTSYKAGFVPPALD
jgi:hypothetical protein